MGLRNPQRLANAVLCLLTLLPVLLVLGGCGALEPKYFPSKQTITTAFFPSGIKQQKDEPLEQTIGELLAGRNLSPGELQAPPPRAVGAGENVDRIQFPQRGRLLIVYTLAEIDPVVMDPLKRKLNQHPLLDGVTMAVISKVPNLDTVRLMGARQRSRYVLVVNTFSNTYRYHNAWTVPTILTLGLGYFWFDTQTVMAFVKTEYSLLDIENNVILHNDAALDEAWDRSTLPASGIIQYRVENRATAESLKKLVEKMVANL
jgi:hypothetical protein